MKYNVVFNTTLYFTDYVFTKRKHSFSTTSCKIYSFSATSCKRKMADPSDDVFKWMMQTRRRQVDVTPFKCPKCPERLASHQASLTYFVKIMKDMMVICKTLARETGFCSRRRHYVECDAKTKRGLCAGTGISRFYVAPASNFEAQDDAC